MSKDSIIEYKRVRDHFTFKDSQKTEEIEDNDSEDYESEEE